MKTNRFIARALVLLGFGAAAGLATGCGASRAQKSRTSNSPAAEPAVIDGEGAPIRVMYGVPSAQFDPDKDIRQKAVGKVVTGRVTDADSGEPLIGVVVSVRDNSVATITDPEGRYTIDAGTADSLFFTFFGYSLQTVKITGGPLDVRMKEDPAILDKVNVVGMYGVLPVRFDPDKPVPATSETEQNPANESR